MNHESEVRPAPGHQTKTQPENRITTRKTWQIYLEGKTRKLEVRRGFWNGKHEIWLDGQLIASGKHLLGTGSAHSFNIASHNCELLSVSNGFVSHLLLLIDEVPYLAEEDADKGKDSDQLLKRLRADAAYWSDIARLTNLKTFDVPETRGIWRNRLIGEIRGYPVVLCYGMTTKPPREFVLVWVRHAAMSNSGDPENNLAHDEELENLLGKVKQGERFFGEESTWVTFPYRPRKESGFEIAMRLDRVVTLISRYAAPPDLQKCDSNSCTEPQGDIHLAFVDRIPVFLCSACVADSATWGAKTKQIFDDAPSRLIQGALVGLGIAFLGSLLWATLASTLGGIAGMVGLVVLSATVAAMNRIRTKPTFTSLLLAIILASSSGFLGAYWTTVWKLLQQTPQPWQGIALGDLLRNAGVLMRDSSLKIAWVSAILIAIYGLSFWPERHTKIVRMFKPHIEIVDSAVTAELLHTRHSHNVAAESENRGRFQPNTIGDH